MDEHRKLRMRIFRLFKQGQLKEAVELFESNNMDYFETAPTDKWNWLHQLSMGFNPDEPPKRTIEFFIEKGVPIDAQDIYGMTPLHYAMRGENAEAAIALLEAGANPNIPNRDNLIPLRMTLLMPDRLDVLDLMLKNGGNVNYYNGKDYLLEAVKGFRGDHPDFQELIQMLENNSDE